MRLLDLDLTNRVALVTAASSGIGRATARGLLELGATVWVNGRDEQRLLSTVDDLRAAVPGADVRAAPGDVDTARGVEDITRQVPEVDILVNMAGGTAHHRPFVELTDADWQEQWDHNLMSAVRLTRHYVPTLLQRSFGRIIFVTSESGLLTAPDVVDYGVTKAALIRLSRAVAEIFVGTDVTANCIVPGATRTDWVVRDAGDDVDAYMASFLRERVPTSLLQRFAEPEEVANLVLYLCSPASSATRGALLRVEGGSIRTD